MKRAATRSKEATHDRIVEAAARAIRRSGYNGTGVAQIMHDAGLTHGGFYAHFPSREALLDEAVAQMTAESDIVKRLSQHPDAPGLALADFLEHYLSTGHCERRPGACPLPILLPEV